MGADLDPELKDFGRNSKEKRAMFFDSCIRHEQISSLVKASPPNFDEYPVFVTSSDRDKYTAIENLTITKLTTLVEEKLESVTDEEMKEDLRAWELEVTKAKKRVNKVAYVEFYMELVEYLENEEYYSTFNENSTETVNENSTETDE